MKNKRTSGLNKKGVLLTLSLTGALIPSANSSAWKFSELWQSLNFSGVYTYLRSLGSRGIDFLFNFFSSLVGRSAQNDLEEDPQKGGQNQGPSAGSESQNNDTWGKIFSGDNLQRGELYKVALEELKGENGGISKDKELLGSLLEKVKKGLGEEISSKIHLEYNERESLFEGTVEILGKKIPVVFVGIKVSDIVSPNFLVYKRHLGSGKPERKKNNDKEETLRQTIEAFKNWYTAVKSIFDYCGKLAKTEIFDIDESQEGKGKLTFKVKEGYKIFVSTYGHHAYRDPGEHPIQLDKLIFDIGKAEIGVYEKSNIMDVMYPNEIYNDENLKKFEEKILKNVLNSAEKIKKGEEVKIFTNEESDGATTSV